VYLLDALDLVALRYGPHGWKAHDAADYAVRAGRHARLHGQPDAIRLDAKCGGPQTRKAILDRGGKNCHRPCAKSLTATV
jgi:hypothetical protein